MVDATGSAPCGGRISGKDLERALAAGQSCGPGGALQDGAISYDFGTSELAALADPAAQGFLRWRIIDKI